MAKKYFSTSFYFLPLFFLLLAGSPNIVGWRIGLVLAGIYLLLLPVGSYLTFNWRKRGMTADGTVTFSFIDFVVLVMFIVALNLGWQVNRTYNILQIVYLLYLLVVARWSQQGPLGIGRWLIYFGQGVLLYALLFTGLNQYDFTHLMKGQNIIFALLCSLLAMLSLLGGQLKKEYPTTERGNLTPLLILQLITLVLFSVFFMVDYKLLYAVFFALALLPALVMALRPGRPVALGQLLVTQTITLLVFFIYFFLDSTQVLQAVLGGY